MPALVTPAFTYSPVSDASPAAAFGQAFEHAWRARSATSRAEMRSALIALVEHFRDEDKSPEAAVIAFKETIHRFGGVHARPGLALEHHADCDECDAEYAYAFEQFVEFYFAVAPRR